MTATFSEAVTGFAIGDVIVGNGAASNFDDSAAPVYTFDVTPSSNGTVTVDIAADVAVNTAGSGNAAATQLSVTVDVAAPTVALTSDASAAQSGSFIVTATFSEPVTGFTLEDITVVNGSKAALTGSGSTYTFNVTPVSDGTVTVDIAAGVVVDEAGNDNTAAAQLSVTVDETAPTVVVSGPTEVVTEDFTVTVTFSEVVTGFGADDVTVVNGTKGAVSGSGSEYSVAITPHLGATVKVSVRLNAAQDSAGNGNFASNLFEVLAGSAASEFARAAPEIKKQIHQIVQNSLTASIQANVRMSNDAKSRFIIAKRMRDDESLELVGQNNVPFDVDGNLLIQDGKLSSSGTFFEQSGSDDGQNRRLFFGDFSISAEKGGSTTYSINGRLAWEKMLSDTTMFGYFLGAELDRTDIRSSFEGTQKGYGLNLGAYVVSEVKENIYVNGFVSVGFGKSDLEMSDGVLSLDGAYNTKSVTLGGAITGVYEMGIVEFWPEFSFAAGKTQIGTANFTGRAYGLVDNTLSLDAGDVAVANVTLRPEIRIDLAKGVLTQRQAILTYAPRLVCEFVRTDVVINTCGRGAEIGFLNTSADGMTSINGRIMLDRIGGRTRRGLELKLQHKF